MSSSGNAEDLSEVVSEPTTTLVGDFLEGAWLGEKVSRIGDDRKRAPSETATSLSVDRDEFSVSFPNEEERRAMDGAKFRPDEIEAPPAATECIDPSVRIRCQPRGRRSAKA